MIEPLDKESYLGKVLSSVSSLSIHRANRRKGSSINRQQGLILLGVSTETPQAEFEVPERLSTLVEAATQFGEGQNVQSRTQLGAW